MFEGVKSNLFLPILNPDDITDAIVKAIKNDKLFVKMLPLVKGILPTRAFDWFAGELPGV